MGFCGTDNGDVKTADFGLPPPLLGLGDGEVVLANGLLRFCAALCVMLAYQKMEDLVAMVEQRATSTSHQVTSKGKKGSKIVQIEKKKDPVCHVTRQQYRKPNLQRLMVGCGSFNGEAISVVAAANVNNVNKRAIGRLV